VASEWRGLRVAGLRVAVEAPPELPWCWPEGPLRRFADDAAGADLRVAVRVGPVEAPPSETIRYDSGGGIFDVALGANEIVFALRIRGVLQRVARFDADLRDGEVVVAPDSLYARECHYPLAYPLDELIFLHRIVREGGLLVHACGVAREGAGLVFTGPSGAGKTTIARLMRRHARARVLSDDRVVLRDAPGGVDVHGTPWHGDAPLSEARAERLVAVHAIYQSRVLVAEPLAGAAAATALLGNAFVPTHEPVGAACALDFAARLVERVPVIRLGFPKDERVVRYAFGARIGERPARSPRARAGAHPASAPDGG
jgi:hypothetical protein